MSGEKHVAFVIAAGAGLDTTHAAAMTTHAHSPDPVPDLEEPVPVPDLPPIEEFELGDIQEVHKDAHV